MFTVQSVPLGRIIIETRPDVAPKMCENFKALTTKERGKQYLFIM